MSDYICLSILVLICIIGVLWGSAGIVMGIKEKDDIDRNDTANATIIMGVVVLVISLLGFYFLKAPYVDTLSKKVEGDTEYKDVHQDEIKSFVNCYKENGYNVCETKDKNEKVETY